MTHFTPISALLGGVLIGLGASLLLLTHGRIAGISGIYSGLLQRSAPDRAYRLSFLIGLLAAGVLGRLVWPTAIGAATVSIGFVIAAGLLVGYGTRLGSGCTSGHGVCGISRLSVRSILATAVFLATGVITVLILRIVGVFGGAP